MSKKMYVFILSSSVYIDADSNLSEVHFLQLPLVFEL